MRVALAERVGLHRVEVEAVIRGHGEGLLGDRFVRDGEEDRPSIAGDIIQRSRAIARGQLPRQARGEVVAIDEGQRHRPAGAIRNGLHAVDVFRLFRLIAFAVEERLLVGRKGDPFIGHIAGQRLLLERFRVDGDELGHVAIFLGEVEQTFALRHPSEGILVVIGRDRHTPPSLNRVEFFGVSRSLAVAVGISQQDIVPLRRHFRVIHAFPLNGIIQFNRALATLPHAPLHVFPIC